MERIVEILDLWFSEETRRCWFEPTPAFDREIRERFADVWTRAAHGDLKDWEQSPEGCLALCVLLDQMPRNMFRGTPQVYTTDPMAREVAEGALARSFDRGLSPEQKQFLYLPFSHSERLADQRRAVALFEAAGLDEALVYVRGHRRIIRRFGRFPHRNAILERASTPEELAFLAQHPDDYGQSAARSGGGTGAADRSPADPDVAARATAGS
jgi:uncharacterized protein (DUF924 family)